LEPIVPNRIYSLNFLAIGIIIGLGILFQIFNYYVIEQVTDKIDVIELSVSVVFGIASIMSFMVSRRYNWKAHVFGKSYFSLGFAYLMFVIGEIIWDYYEVMLNQHPYPSIADIFYFAFYPFAIYHLVKNCRFFQPKFSVWQKSILIISPITVFVIYAYLSHMELDEFGLDFYYGSTFVAGTSITLALAMLGVTIFRKSALGIVWVMLSSGIFLNSIADVWYYYLELFELYSREHVTMALWFTSTNFIIYALYKHCKSV
jgi:hypothetical protein